MNRAEPASKWMSGMLSHIHEPTSAVFDPVDWRGHWIGPELIVDPDGSLDLFAHSTQTRGFSRTLFRRRVELVSAPASAPVRLTADSRYVLWVNGHELGRGPVRSQPRRWRYDEYDLAPYLRAGTNVVAMVVTYYGRPNSLWQPAVAAGGLGADAIMVMEGRLGDIELLTDADWLVLRSTAWTEVDDHERDLHGVPVEVFDARELPAGWLEEGFDDSGWSKAAVLSAVHLGALARSRPPTNPYGRLLPRPIGALAGDTVVAQMVLARSTCSTPAWTSDHPADRVCQVLRAAAGPVLPGGSLPVRASVAAGEVLQIAVDFGRIVAGFIELDLDAPAGTVVELLYRERVYKQGRETITDPRTGARYIVAGTGEAWTAMELNGLRYVYIVVHADTAVDLAINRIAVREHTYPHNGGNFRSNDAEIDALYQAGVRTVQLNSFDAFTDCPTREQRAFVGDAVVHQMVQLTTNEDWQLAKYYVELGDSPRYDGMLPMSVVGDIEHIAGYTIPDWALHWVHGVHNLYRYTGERALVLRYLPSVERVLRWYESYVDAHGTLSNVAEWNLVDWSSVFVSGRSSILTALWARGLRELAEMSGWLGNAGTASWARSRYEDAKAGFEDFWDAERGVYVDHIVDGQRQTATSQAANATAIVSCLAPERRWAAVANAMTDPSKVVINSWIGDYNLGGYDPDRAVTHLRGIQDITWDAKTEIVRAEPFFSYVVHDALAAAGRFERLLDVLRDWSQFLVDGYDTFGECWGWGTPVHGWSATPTRDLVQYIAGITPAEPGYQAIRIAPRPGVLTRIATAVPTPHGLLEMIIVDNNVEITSPASVEFIDLDGEQTRLPPGKHHISLRQRR
jgi:hypothetical protein